MSETAPTPATALEVELPGIGDPASLVLRHRPLPQPGRGQVRVRMEATGVSFAEQQMRLGKYYDQPAFPFVPGYDLVGVVDAVGDDVALPAGTRVAALTKTGGWASHVVLDADAVTPVPDGVTPEAAETVVVNGITAWRMLHRAARVRKGETIVVLGAAGGVGSTLVQLARHAGVRVIGTASGSQVAAVEALGAIAIDRRSEDVPARVRALEPDGVAAVFDHVGGPGIADSWRMLARGGTLVSYGTASTKNDPGNPRIPVLKLIARLLAWRALPNGRRAMFFDLWAGKRNRDRYRRELSEDLATVLGLVRDGTIDAQVGASYPLERAAEALARAERGGLTGKVVITAS